MGVIKTYQCVFCDKTFSRKSWYDKHVCAKKKRFAEANNLITIKAMQLYQHWNRKVGNKPKRTDKPMQEFMSSPFYKTFKKLAEFSQTNYVVSTFRYLEWLIANQIREKNWTNAKNLESFRQHIRDQEGIEDQVEVSFRNIRAWCTEHDNTPIGEFFAKVSPLDALIMVQQNRLLPWVLLGYTRSVDQLINRMTQSQILALDEFINLEYWMSKIEEHPDKQALVQKLSTKQSDEAT
jgi:hypothetical protein